MRFSTMQSDGNPLSQAQRTHYLYADEGLIAEAPQNITLNPDGTVTANGTPAITTQYGPKPGNPFTTGILFIKTRNSNGQDTVAYYHHDHLQTPLQATDKQGNLVWAASYNAFGQATIITPDPTESQPTIVSNLRLPGQYEDEETGLYYNWNRYYDPARGGYTQWDPIGLGGGVNTYAYVGGNPISLMDPEGLVRIHGNWCGSDWTGGREEEYSSKNMSLYKDPIDKLDGACKRHDICYARCRADDPCDQNARSQCFLKCDAKLAGAAENEQGSAAYAVEKAMKRSPKFFPRDPGPNSGQCMCSAAK